MAAAPRRTLLSGPSGATSRVSVYLTPSALEVEDVEGYDVTVRKVFFDDVLLVTYHRPYGWGFLVGMAAMTTLFGLLTLAVAAGGNLTAGLAFFVITVLPFLVALGLRLALRLDVITVYGRRSRARIQFWIRKGRARETYERICRLAREQQARV